MSYSKRHPRHGQPGLKPRVFHICRAPLPALPCQQGTGCTCGSPGGTSWRRARPGHTSSGSGTGSQCVSRWCACSSGRSSSRGNPRTRCAQRPDSPGWEGTKMGVGTGHRVSPQHSASEEGVGGRGQWVTSQGGDCWLNGSLPPS